MRFIYSILREINEKSLPTAKDYGYKQREFENLIFTLEKEGYVERVLRIDTFFSLKPARLTQKGHELLESLRYFDESYPGKKGLINWLKVEKEESSYADDEEDY